MLRFIQMVVATVALTVAFLIVAPAAAQAGDCVDPALTPVNSIVPPDGCTPPPAHHDCSDQGACTAPSTHTDPLEGTLDSNTVTSIDEGMDGQGVAQNEGFQPPPPYQVKTGLRSDLFTNIMLAGVAATIMVLVGLPLLIGWLARPRAK